MPAQADALNDLSSIPPVSVTMHAVKSVAGALDPPGVDEPLPPPAGAVVPPPLLLLPHAPSSSAKAAIPAVIATPYVRRNAITSPVCPDSARQTSAGQCTAGDR